MIAVDPTNHRNALRSNRWSSTGLGGVHSMAVINGRGSGQTAIFGARPGCSAARIGTLGIARQPARGPRPTTIITSRALKDAMRRTKAALAFLCSPSSLRDVRETCKWIMQLLVRQPRLSSTVPWS
jgi:hypothetical protein